MFRFCDSQMSFTFPIGSHRVMATKGWFFVQMKDLFFSEKTEREEKCEKIEGWERTESLERAEEREGKKTEERC